MRLTTRFLLLRAAMMLVVAVFFWLTFEAMVEGINRKWGQELAQRQVLFDKYRTLSPLIGEIALARRMASEPALIALAQHPDEPALKKRALQVLEDYRIHFSDHSYFVALAENGAYYYNDADNRFAGRQLRYTLSPQKQDDQWFYATLSSGQVHQVNVDPDVHLGVVKVWINVLLKHEGATLGVVGTGIDLTEFLKQSVGIKQHGVDNFFVDRSLAIQLSTDPELIDYASIAKKVDERIRINVLFKNPADIQALQAVAAELLTKPAFDSLETGRLKAELLSVIEAKGDRPNTQSAEAFNLMLFKDHPYAHPGMGDAESVSRISRQDLADMTGTTIETSIRIMSRWAKDRIVQTEKDGFVVLPYINDDPIICKKLEDIGCAAVMPLAAPIGSGMGIRNPTNIQIILETVKVPVIVDAGVGCASDAAIAMELGCAAVLMNTGIAGAKDPIKMARAMKLAVEAGRFSYESGRIQKKLYATASSPIDGVICK